MKTFITIALIALSMLLPLSMAQYSSPNDQAKSCLQIGKMYNRFSLSYISDSLQRCQYCQYRYNDLSDPVYGGCAECPQNDGSCTSCVSGYKLFEGKCISCGEGVKSCTITNQNFKNDPIIQEVLESVRQSNDKTPKQKILDEMKIHQQYLAIRAEQCYEPKQKDGVIVEIGSVCMKIQNCEKVDRTSTTISCSKCKPGYYFDQHFSCVNQCKANVVQFNNNKYEFSASQTCNDCSYEGVCKTCPAGTIEVSSNNKDALNAVQSSSHKVCQKCMNNCKSCSVSDSLEGKIKCNACQDGFFYNSNSNTCDKCNADSFLINSPSNSQSINLVCTGNSFNQIDWESSKLTQIDALGQSYTYALKTTNDSKAYICGDGAITCESKNGAIVNTGCLYGYALKENQCVSCNELAANSILCEYNNNLSAYIPTLCKFGSDFDIPYKESYSLQITIGQVETLVLSNKIQYSDVPNPNTWCQKNTNQCKIFIPLDQNLTLKLSSEEYQGSCSECFTDDDIPVFYKKIEKQDFFKVEKSSYHACLRCSDIPNAQECSYDKENKKLVPTQCASSYYLDSTNKQCKKCDSSCLECQSESTTCTLCQTGNYLTNDKKCSAIVETQVKQLENCLNQSEVNGEQSCEVCEKNYNKVKQENEIFLCQVQPIENCDEMEGSTCKRCVQDGKQYYLKDNKCQAIPQGCASFSNGNCSVCQYSYKPINISESQVCVPCYQEYKEAQTFIQYDCPGKVKAATLEDDDVIPIQPKSNSMILLLSAIYFVLFMMF